MASSSIAPTYHHSEHAATYQSKASFVYSAANTSAVLQLLDARPGQRVLDIGCGSGELTRIIAQQVGEGNGAGKVVGVDASEDMLRSARLAGSGNIEYHLVDCCGLPSWLRTQPGLFHSFDSVFSNAALHWMKASPIAVVRGAHQALKPGGSFIGECGGFLNMIGVRGALHAMLRRYAPEKDPNDVDPWYFPTPEAYRKLLSSPGEEGQPMFEVESCELVPRPTTLPAGLRGWLETFGGTFLNALPSNQVRARAMEELEEMLRPDMYDEESGTWTAMYVRLRFKAIKSPRSAASSFAAPSAIPAIHESKKLQPDAASFQAAEAIQARFINRTVLIHLRLASSLDSRAGRTQDQQQQQRVFKGVFKCVDDAGNVVLSDTEEWMLHDQAGSGDAEMATEDRVASRRFVGMVMIRGEDAGRVEVQDGDAEGRGGGAGPMGAGWPDDPNMYA